MKGSDNFYILLRIRTSLHARVKSRLTKIYNQWNKSPMKAVLLNFMTVWRRFFVSGLILTILHQEDKRSMQFCKVEHVHVTIQDGGYSCR